jgi:hypothetical protein
VVPVLAMLPELAMVLAKVVYLPLRNQLLYQQLVMYIA